MNSRSLAIPSSALLLTLLGACAEVPEPAACASTSARTAYGIDVTSVLTMAELDGDGVSLDIVELGCVDFEVTDADDPTWSLSGTAPSGFDVEPGTYRIEARYSLHGVDYASAPVVVEHAYGGSEVTLELCPDVVGEWSCTTGGATWSLEVSEAGACSVALEPLGIQATLTGQLIEGEALVGVVDFVAQEMSFDDAMHRDRSRCSRVTTPQQQG